jgi:hypothetical protein
MADNHTQNAPRHVRHAHKHYHVKNAKSKWVEKEPAHVPMPSQSALREAMKIMDIPPTQFDDLLWIMAQESEVVINKRNGESTARGLFQLLQMQYDLNPNGEKSFGNAVEECQGGIHYIMGRYHSAATAKAFWLKHHWY